MTVVAAVIGADKKAGVLRHAPIPCAADTFVMKMTAIMADEVEDDD